MTDFCIWENHADIGIHYHKSACGIRTSLISPEQIFGCEVVFCPHCGKRIKYQLFMDGKLVEEK